MSPRSNPSQFLDFDSESGDISFRADGRDFGPSGQECGTDASTVGGDEGEACAEWSMTSPSYAAAGTDRSFAVHFALTVGIEHRNSL